jgi:hypothetical protein
MSALLDATDDLSTLDTKEIISARELIEDFTENLSAIEAASTTSYITNLKAALQNDSEAAKMLSNKTAAGEVCGTVTNASDNPVDNIRIFARDFSDFSKMAKTKTAADGSYCFNAPVGQELLVGAINRTTVNDAASEFYTSASPASGSGTKCHLIHCGEKLTVTTSTTANFKLVQGGRITGTITGLENGNSVALKKVKVLFRNALTKKPAGATKTNGNGVYTMNLAPGDYIVYFKNSTKKAFGSLAYTNGGAYYTSGQAVDRNFAKKLTLAAGISETANIELLAGGTLTGTITDNNGDPVEFAKLRIDQIKDAIGATVDLQADRFHTNKLGIYTVQLPFGTYTISARGEFKDGVGSAGYTLDSNNLSHTINFDHQTNAITFKLTDGTDGIGSITAKLRNVANGKTTGNPTMSDGTATLHVPDGDYFFSVTVNNGTNTGSCNWNPANSVCDATKAKNIDQCTDDTYTDQSTCEAANKAWTDTSDKVTISANDTTTFANIAMPTGYVITGIVEGDSGPIADAKVLPLIKDPSTNSWETFTTVRTGADGIYTLSLPSATYRLFAKTNNGYKVKYLGSGNTGGCSISAAKTVNFDIGADSADVVMKSAGTYICP